MAATAAANGVEDPDGDSSASSVSSTGTLVPDDGRPRTGPSAEVPWVKYFDKELFLDTEHATFHAYLTSPNDPSKDPLIVCHHGAGSSGLSFALFASAVHHRLPGAGVLAVDARAHGLTRHAAENEISRANLADDLQAMIELTKAEQKWTTMPNIVLVGHSLGGAVVTQIAKSSALGGKLVGFVVIDVVEGSAIEALKFMQSNLLSRPNRFPSTQAGVDWHVRSRTIRNRQSAEISAPSLLVEAGGGQMKWRTDLASTEQYWQDWFAGMSSDFLAGKAAKLLLLAGTDRLDKELMIGQMQGKFQLQIFPEAGHFVQEDSPEKTADVVVEFFKRNDRSSLVLPPKVSELLKQGEKV